MLPLILAGLGAAKAITGAVAANKERKKANALLQERIGKQEAYKNKMRYSYDPNKATLSDLNKTESYANNEALNQTMGKYTNADIGAGSAVEAAVRGKTLASNGVQFAQNRAMARQNIAQNEQNKLNDMSNIDENIDKLKGAITQGQSTGEIFLNTVQGVGEGAIAGAGMGKDLMDLFPSGTEEIKDMGNPDSEYNKPFWERTEKKPKIPKLNDLVNNRFNWLSGRDDSAFYNWGK